MATKRKPWLKEPDCCWWTNNPVYRFYMLREGCSVFMVWASLLLTIFLLAPETFAALVKNPVVCLLNLAAFLASLLHTKPWYDLVPKVVPFSDALKAKLVKGLWAATFGFSGLVILLSAV